MREITIYFATNRQVRTRGDVDIYSDEIDDASGATYRVGKAKVAVSKGEYKVRSHELFDEKKRHICSEAAKVLEDDSIPEERRYRVAREVATAHVGPQMKLGSGDMMEEIQNRMRSGQCDVLLLLHGFASEFETGLERIAELVDKYQGDGVKEMVGFVFCWPSKGRIFPPWRYSNDRRTAELSGYAIARAFCRLIDHLSVVNQKGERCNQRLHLVAHSMGNYVLRSALNSLLDEHMIGRRVPLFEHIFLMAADEDDDALEKEQKLGRIDRIGRNIHVYYSKQDRALDVSDLTKGNAERLGSHGPKNMGKTSDQVVAVDCHKVDDTEFGHANHQYYRLHPKVIGDVVQVLAGNASDEIQGRQSINNHPRRFRILD
ncbi:MAG: alpha/beta hydrolase [Xanthomonadales bacterium]|nr:alpha/beta hydrolase [Xanthomonadales bacterium]